MLSYRMKRSPIAQANSYQGYPQPDDADQEFTGLSPHVSDDVAGAIDLSADRQQDVRQSSAIPRRTSHGVRAAIVRERSARKREARSRLARRHSRSTILVANGIDNDIARRNDLHLLFACTLQSCVELGSAVSMISCASRALPRCIERCMIAGSVVHAGAVRGPDSRRFAARQLPMRRAPRSRDGAPV